MEETFCGHDGSICLLVYDNFDWVTSGLMRSAAYLVCQIITNTRDHNLQHVEHGRAIYNAYLSSAKETETRSRLNEYFRGGCKVAAAPTDQPKDDTCRKIGARSKLMMLMQGYTVIQRQRSVDCLRE